MGRQLHQAPRKHGFGTASRAGTSGATASAVAHEYAVGHTLDVQAVRATEPATPTVSLPSELRNAKGKDKKGKNKDSKGKDGARAVTVQPQQKAQPSVAAVPSAPAALITDRAKVAEILASFTDRSRPTHYTGPITDVTTKRDVPFMPLISVICPTFNRPDMHASLYEIYIDQDYPLKELWILDDSPTPSPLFSACKDSDVHYVHTTQRRTIGAKRNLLILLSAGSVIAHFDDDDWYAPNYLTRMLQTLKSEDADFVKLAKWREHRLHDDHRRTFDTQAHRHKHPDMWGFGFTYMYRRYAATRAGFPHTSAGEDYAFLTTLQAAGLKTVQVEGDAGLAEHILHGRNVSRKD